MTEYELVDAIASYNDQGMTALLAYLTVVSGYLITAYFVGNSLTPTQNGIISILFLSFGCLVIYNVYGSYSRSLFFWEDLLVIRPDSVGYLQPWIPGALAVVLTGGMLASIKFMWDVRHPKSE